MKIRVEYEAHEQKLVDKLSAVVSAAGLGRLNGHLMYFHQKNVTIDPEMVKSRMQAQSINTPDGKVASAQFHLECLGDRLMVEELLRHTIEGIEAKLGRPQWSEGMEQLKDEGVKPQ